MNNGLIRLSTCPPLWPRALLSPSDSTGDDRTGIPRRVLVVEADFLVAGELEYWLKESGFQVIGPATTADEAVALAGQAKPDLVIMDVRLAGARDGIDAAVEIFEQFAVRSFFASAHSDPQTVARGKAANPLGWIAKPYDPAALVADIKAYFED